MLGTLLNPLNSSMIGVALVPLHLDFRVSLAAVAWLVSGFYLAAAVAQPLMGRLADGFGHRRVFLAGLVLAFATGALAPLAPAFAWLVGVRIVQALGTSAAFPAGLAMIRAASDPGGRPPAAALGAIAVAAALSASLGPTIGGFLVASAGWQAIFLVNIPVTLIGLVLALRWLPPDAPAALAGGRLLDRIDLPGVALFAVVLVGLLAFLLSLPDLGLWPLLLAAGAAAVLLVRRELHVAEPFLDLRMLQSHRPLIAVYLQFAAVNLVYYSVFFAMPIWLEEARHLGPGATGLVLLPISGLGVLVTPLVARMISRSGHWPALLIGAFGLTAAALALLTLDSRAPVVSLLLVTAAFGIPYSCNNLGLQAALYRAAPAGATGAAGGQFQTFRYLGAILSTSLIGLVFGRVANDSGLHTAAFVLSAISGLLVVTAVTAVRYPGR